MTHVLRMAAFEIGDPVAKLVLMKAGDLAIHRVAASPLAGIKHQATIERQAARGALGGGKDRKGAGIEIAALGIEFSR